MPILSDFYRPPTPKAEPSQEEGSHEKTIQTGAAFAPDIGKCYEVHFGEIEIDQEKSFVSAHIRVNGQSYLDWIDLKTNRPLDPRLGRYVVQAFREISCPDSRLPA